VLRDWFQRKQIDSFATALAQDLGRRFPPQSEERTDKGAKNQLASITDGLYAHAANFRQEKGLGIYGKAKLGNTFRWQLKELGYSQTFVNEVTHGLVLRLAKGRKVSR
jgi:hypothetical protein